MRLLVFLIPIIFCSCSSVQVNNSNSKYGFYPSPGMSEDAQDRYDTKYNIMDSSDGSKDPNAKVKVWGAVY